jgi:hypothetical protein
MHPAPLAVGADLWRQYNDNIKVCTDGHVEVGVEVKTLLVDIPDPNLFWNAAKPERCSSRERNPMAGQGASDVWRVAFCATLGCPLLAVVPSTQRRKNSSYQVTHAFHARGSYSIMRMVFVPGQ